MITRARLASLQPVDTTVAQVWRERRTDQEMIKPRSGVALPAIATIVPECVKALVAVKLTYRISATLFDETGIRRAARRLHQSVVIPGFRLVNVNFGRGHVVSRAPKAGRTFAGVSADAEDPSGLTPSLNRTKCRFLVHFVGRKLRVNPANEVQSHKYCRSS